MVVGQEGQVGGQAARGALRQTRRADTAERLAAERLPVTQGREQLQPRPAGGEEPTKHARTTT